MLTQDRINEYFPNIIGQKIAKKSLAFHLDNYQRSRNIPNLLFVASRGAGKTHLARATARQLKDVDGETKEYMEINCSQIKNATEFAEQILMAHVVDRDVTVTFDECHAIPKDVQNAMLSMFEVNDSNRTTFTAGDMRLDLNFHRQSFIFCTTEPQQLTGAFKSRFKRVDLETYSEKDLGDMTKLYLEKKEVEFDEKVLPKIAAVVRGSARAVVSMVNDIANFTYGGIRFTNQKWDEMCDGLGIMPLGISPNELTTLRTIAEENGISLTKLAAMTAMTTESLRRDVESFLLAKNLIEIKTPNGRVVTQTGRDLLKKIDGQQ